MKKFFFLSFLFLFPILGFSQRSNSDQSIDDEFESDMLRIDEMMQELIDKDASTLAMIDTYGLIEEKYDDLLNKYYQILIGHLSVEERKVMQTTQRNWIKYRDSEKELIATLVGNTYERMGGGSMWAVVAARQRMQLTKQRVIDLVNYLSIYSF